MSEKRKKEWGWLYGVFLVGLLIAAMVIGWGCAERVSMSPGYARQVELASITADELNRRCQAGDPNACRVGLQRTTETLRLIIDAMHGRSSEGGDVRE